LQPASQDRPEQKPVKEKPNQPRKREGQSHHRVLVEQADEMIQHKPVRCRRCGALLLGEDAKPYRHQVTEFPVVQALIRHWLTAGLDATSSRTAATCRPLLDRDTSLWLFTTKLGVETHQQQCRTCAAPSCHLATLVAWHPIRSR
jgi:hypothetical protein